MYCITQSNSHIICVRGESKGGDLSIAGDTLFRGPPPRNDLPRGIDFVLKWREEKVVRK